MTRQIEEVCLRNDLSTYDPYDIWKTGVGFRIKHFYNCRRILGLPAAAALTIFDLWINNSTRCFYAQQEIPIVRATAALTLLQLYRVSSNADLTRAAERHINWCIQHSCRGFSGLCWGLDFPNAVSRELIYGSNVPYSTMTPYILEAMVEFSRLTRLDTYGEAIQSIFRFFDQDLKVMEETEETLATSYCPFRDRTVTNSVSYTMYSLALCSPWLLQAERDRTSAKVCKLHKFVLQQQRSDGSWLYSPQGKSFIDCFHTCIVLKNLLKTNRLYPLPGTDAAIQRGVDYLKAAFLCPGEFLFRRFSVRNKLGVVRFDLYDNAEALSLAVLLGEHELAVRLEGSILAHFVRGTDVFSQIDVTGRLRNKNMLRWAVMPFFHATAQLLAI